MAEPRLLRRLDQVGTRLQLLRFLWAATIGWLVLAAAVLSLRWANQVSLAWSLILFGIPVVLLAALFASARRKGDRHASAVLIEKTFPELDSRLLTAVQQQPRGHSWDFTFLQSELLAEVFAQLRHQDWHRAVAARRLIKAQCLHAVSLMVLLALLIPLWSDFKTSNIATSSEPPTGAPADSRLEVVVEPGNTEVERGTGLLVMARFPGRLPTDVELVATDSDAKEIRIPLQKSLDDPLFGGRITNVERDLKYHVEFTGGRSEEFQITAFDYPGLLKADANISYPDYTQLDSKTIPDVRKLTVIEGSKVDLQCWLNKPVTSAVLVDDDAREIELAAISDQENLKSSQWTFEKPGEWKYRLHLKDKEGRTNREPIEFHVTVTPNHQPDLVVSFPRKDLRVSSLQELMLNAKASDDFGLKGLGLIYQTPDGEEKQIDFAKTAAPDETALAEHLLAMESLDVKPDDLLSYYFYADDIGPDGAQRRSFSDIYFAEVRPFEEIFRQMPPPPKGEGGEDECKKLLELQRQVVAASWNVIRREKEGQLSNTFVPEITTLEESQIQIRQIAETFKTRLNDVLLQQFADEAIRHMATAIEEFQAGATGPALPPVTQGRSAAQSAYQALLKLQSRENVLRQSQAGSGTPQEPKNNMNQQLQALKLKNDRDRYETERQARGEQSNTSKDALQILNRLKELARRQEDLNNRIRDLETALRNAATEEERQEIDRQLKRLQSEQEELLRNLDDVREKMNEEKNRSKMADARKQADEARERVYQSSEALKEGRTTRALTEGTRAERQLQQMNDDLRKQTSGQFEETVRQLREDVRQLANQEEKLAERLTHDSPKPAMKRRSLSDSPAEEESNSLSADFQAQKEALNRLTEEMKKVVEDAESSEPLLSKKLYDSLRSAKAHRPEESLETLVQYAQRGIHGPLQEIEQQARDGINELQSGIEDAAESILGNEKSSLQQARSELARLTDAIGSELASHQQSASDKEKKTKDKKPGTPGEPSSGQQPSTLGEQTATQAQNAGKNSTAQQQNDQQQSGQQSDGQRERSPGQTPSAQPGNNEQPGQGRSSESMAGKSQQGSQPSGDQAQGQQLGNGTQQGQGKGKGKQQGEGKQQGQGEGPSTESLAAQLARQLGLGGSHNAVGSGPEDGPISGGSYTQWSDQMRDLEEMLTTPELRAQVAAIRDRARMERIEIKRHSKAPDWELVRTSIYGPLVELQAQIDEELARLDPDRKLVPIDRDPVPEKYADFVKSYYEQLSRQKTD